MENDFVVGTLWKDKFDDSIAVIVETVVETVYYNKRGLKETQKLPKQLFLKRYARLQ